MTLPSERVLLDSSTLIAAAYDHHCSLLQLEFYDGARYTYSAVSPVTFVQLLQAPSKGAFFNRYIRGHFPYEKRSP